MPIVVKNGYYFTKNEKILVSNISHVKIRQENPYSKLAFLVLKYFKLHQYELIDVMRLVKILHLPDFMAENIVTNLVQNNLLDTAPQNDSHLGILFKINDLGKNAIQVGLPYKEVILPLEFHYVRKPCYQIPDYKMPFGRLTSLPVIKPGLFPFGIYLSESDEIKEIYGLDPVKMYLTEQSNETTSEYLDNDISVTAIIDTKESLKYSDFRILIIKTRPYWKKIISTDHPEVKLIAQELMEKNPANLMQKFLESKFQNTNVEFKISHQLDNSGLLKITNVPNERFPELITILEDIDLNFESILDDSIEIKLPVQFPYSENWEMHYRVNLTCSDKLANMFFLEFLSQALTSRIQDISKVEQKIDGLHNLFCDKLSVKFPIPSNTEINNYCWESRNYQTAYLLNYMKDL